MKRPIGAWRVILLAVLICGPIGYWLYSNHAAHQSQVYAQQTAEAQQARSGLDRSPSLASADQLSKVFRDVSKSLKPSVVSIKNVVERSPRTTRGFRNPGIQGLPPEIERFFGRPFNEPFDSDEDDAGSGPKGRIENGLGSGVIVRSDGYILTNNHVVRDADVLEVVLSDDKKYDAKVIGTDGRTDLAVLKIDATGLVPAHLGDSASMEVGDWVIAIGSPFGLAQTVTAGIVSATNRTDQGITPYDSFIQTDAAINPGNSGGPLLNLKGEVIGINTAIASRSGGYNGICFAVPSNTAQRVLDDLISKGRVTRGVIGVRPATVTTQIAEKLSLPPDTRGALIESITKGFPADKAGLKKGDVIVAIDGNPIASDSAMRRAVGESKPGSQIRIKYLRDGRTNEVSLRVEELDENALAAMSESQSVDSLGITIESLSPELAKDFGLKEGQGVHVKAIKRGSPLAQYLSPGVVIVSVNGTKVSSPDEFVEAINKPRKNGALSFVIRDGESEQVLTIRMGNR